MIQNQGIRPGLSELMLRMARTGMGVVRNRGELLAVEWQEEQARLRQLFVWTVGWLFFGIMTMVLLTATIIYLSPEEFRVYAMAGFTILYLCGAVAAWLILRKRMRH